MTMQHNAPEPVPEFPPAFYGMVWYVVALYGRIWFCLVIEIAIARATEIAMAMAIVIAIIIAIVSHCAALYCVGLARRRRGSCSSPRPVPGSDSN